MIEKANIVKIFLASPGDLKPERELIFALKNDLDDLIGKPYQIRFEFVNWERSAYPGVGEDAQDVINQNIKDDYNIFIGVFWQRFGTPTNRSESGTKEEFERALKKFKKDNSSTHIMIYFKTAPPENLYEIDLNQFEKVRKFKDEIEQEGILYWEFEKTDDLKKLLQLHLAALIKEKFDFRENTSHDVESKSISIVENKDHLNKYELLSQNLEEISEERIGVFELLELTIDTMGRLPVISQKMTRVIQYVTEKFEEKTKQINAVNNIKDQRLKLKKSTEIINRMAGDLEYYSNEINENLPEFSDTLNTAIDSYTRLLLLASKFEPLARESQNQIGQEFLYLYNTIGEALEKIAGFLTILNDLPVMTSKFGTSKRKAVLATNGIFKEFINARKIMKQIIDPE
ncbi:hypothetical protein [Maribacter polysiphoniae]|uniref:hypothetical protein n=1 Tax=Maribacter polysiphoniae TaxID=429344 RepID=UPI002355D131|nr:hypothetical protein [Maribacter polysiphoniae]